MRQGGLKGYTRVVFSGLSSVHPNQFQPDNLGQRILQSLDILSRRSVSNVRNVCIFHRVSSHRSEQVVGIFSTSFKKLKMYFILYFSRIDMVWLFTFKYIIKVIWPKQTRNGHFTSLLHYITVYWMNIPVLFVKKLRWSYRQLLQIYILLSVDSSFKMFLICLFIFNMLR